MGGLLGYVGTIVFANEALLLMFAALDAYFKV